MFESLAGARARTGGVSAPGRGSRAAASAGVSLREPSVVGASALAVAQEQHDPDPRRSDGRPAFYFDLACPFSYIAADRIERLLGDVEWVPVSSHDLRDEQPDPEEIMAAAALAAQAARLPLVTPDNFPAAVPSAMRAAAHAAEHGAGARFVVAATRLAFCGGFDLERRSVIQDLASAARLPAREVLAAATEDWRDAELCATATLLQSEGMTRLPVVGIAGHYFQGEQALSQAVSWRRSA